MKNQLFITLLLLLTACVTTKNADTQTLKLIKAESQAYILGTKLDNGKTSGTTYSMYFDGKGKIEVEKVWIKGINMDFEQDATNAEGSFRVRSTVYGGTTSNQFPEVKAPITYDGQALVQYKENGEVKYYVVKEFKKHEKVTGYN